MKAIAILMVIAPGGGSLRRRLSLHDSQCIRSCCGNDGYRGNRAASNLDKLKTDLAQNSLIGTSFQNDTELGEAQAYQFYTYTVRLRNFSMLTCDMVELQVTPREGDVLQMGNEQSKALSAGATGDISATVLTSVESLPVREADYYVLCVGHSLYSEDHIRLSTNTVHFKEGLQECWKKTLKGQELCRSMSNIISLA